MASAQEGSFSAAARRLGVSIPAVAKMVRALEGALGASFFERSTTGLLLTKEGEDYLTSCGPLLSLLNDADERVRAAATRARGTVTAAIQHAVARELLGMALPRFHERHEDIRIDLKELVPLTESNLQGVDVVIGLGWLKGDSLVQKRVGSAGFTVCASPSYWARMGMPAHPSELARHSCLLVRHPFGTVLDVWRFKRGAELVSVTVDGWMVASNTHRDTLVQAALSGSGVVRLLHWTHHHAIGSGALVPALQDWDSADSAPVNIWYRPSARRTLRVRLFVDFVAEVFREQDQLFALHDVPRAAPLWLRRIASRASNEPRRSRV